MDLYRQNKCSFISSRFKTFDENTKEVILSRLNVFHELEEKAHKDLSNFDGETLSKLFYSLSMRECLKDCYKNTIFDYIAWTKGQLKNKHKYPSYNEGVY